MESNLCLPQLVKSPCSNGDPASVQFNSVAQLCPTLCDPMDCSTPGLPVYHQFPEFTQTYVHWIGDAIQPSYLCCPFLLPPSIFPSIRVFSNEPVLWIRWPKYWSFSFNIVLPLNIQDWFPLGWTKWIIILNKGDSTRGVSFPLLFPNIDGNDHSSTYRGKSALPLKTKEECHASTSPQGSPGVHCLWGQAAGPLHIISW